MKSFFALLLYRLAFIILVPIALILLILRSKKNVAYRHRLLERLGFISKRFNTNGIIIHAASVGEVIAVKPFVEQVIKANPDTPITLTTFTPTGSQQVVDSFSDRVQHCYLPLDNVISNYLFLHKLKPSAMVFMETELWPSLLHQAKRRDCKLLLINGRLTEKSVNHYQKFRALIQPALACFNHILCQSKINQERFLAIGAHAKSCTTSGNLKYDININAAIEEKQQQLAQLITEKKQVWLVASTHPGDESITLNAFKKIIQQQPNTLLILVPRHPERFPLVYQQCIDEKFSTVKRSDKQAVTRSDDIWLIDTLGELMSIFGLADIVTMGGSFSAIGGHNPLEPALFKKAIITGENMSNFTEVMQNLIDAQAVIQLSPAENPADALANEVIHLFNQPNLRSDLGENAHKVVLNNQGATAKSVAMLQQLLHAQH